MGAGRSGVESEFDELYEKMREAYLVVKCEHLDVHIACTPEWFDEQLSDSRFEPDWPTWSGQIGRLTGVQVFVTGDVTDPRGWEARPGRIP